MSCPGGLASPNSAALWPRQGSPVTLPQVLGQQTGNGWGQHSGNSDPVGLWFVPHQESEPGDMG